MSINKYVPRSIQNIKDRLEAYNESITRKLFSTELEKTFEVIIYTYIDPDTKTPTRPEDEDPDSNTSEYYYYKARSLAGHHDHLERPERAKNVDKYERLRNAHFQAIMEKKSEEDLPQLGDVWLATEVGANLVTLTTKKRSGSISLKFETQNEAKDAHTNPSEPVVTNGDYQAPFQMFPDSSDTAQEGVPSALQPDYGSNTLLPPVDASQRKILDFISKGEGSYNASNNGTKYKVGGIVNSIGGTSYVAENLVTSTKQRSDQKLLSTMTLGEIKRLQGWNSNEKLRLWNSTFPSGYYKNTRTLFAVGAYQIIPETFPGAQKAAGLIDSDIYNNDNQDKMGLGLIYGTKRPKLRDYLKGSDKYTLEQAQLDFAQEWASLPDPTKYSANTAGSDKLSYYGKGNKAYHTLSQVAKVLKEVRASNIKNGFTV